MYAPPHFLLDLLKLRPNAVPSDPLLKTKRPPHPSGFQYGTWLIDQLSIRQPIGAGKHRN
jgi:hypothetical protein